jgi:hypothetical protein
MNRITTFLAVGALAVAATLLPAMTTAAQAQYGGNSGDSSVSRRPNVGFEARVQTDRTQYRPGRAVEVTMLLTNIARAAQRPFPGSNREYDFWVRDGRTNQVVYTLSKHRERRPFEPYGLDPGASRYFRELWDQRDDSGKRVPQGVYTVEARIWPQQTVSTQIYLSDEDEPSRPPRPRPGDPDPNPGNPGDNDGLKTTLRADRTRVAPGDSVSLTYTVSNLSDAPLTLNFPSGKQFDMTATSQNGSLAWQQSRGLFYTQSFTRIRLNPGEQKVFNATWQIAPNVPGGVYRLSAFLTPQNARGQAYAPASFRLGIGNAGNDNGLGNGAPGGNGGVYNGGFTPGAPPSDGYGRNGGIVVANPTNGPVIMNGVHLVGLREFVSPRASSYVGQRVTITGTYLGQKGGYGTPPRLRTDWVVVGDGTSIYVSGAVPTDAREGRNIVVTGTARRTNDGRVYIDAN